jgi:phosphoribosylformylglycinamidine synthase PurS subunit
VKVTVGVTRRPQISDPQGVTVLRALHDLGYGEVRTVRINRVIELEVEESAEAGLEERVKEMCERLLANPVIEDYRVEMER